jgi:hypothetical protein
MSFTSPIPIEKRAANINPKNNDAVKNCKKRGILLWDTRATAMKKKSRSTL